MARMDAESIIISYSAERRWFHRSYSIGHLRQYKIETDCSRSLGTAIYIEPQNQQEIDLTKVVESRFSWSQGPSVSPFVGPNFEGASERYSHVFLFGDTRPFVKPERVLVQYFTDKSGDAVVSGKHVHEISGNYDFRFSGALVAHDGEYACWISPGNSDEGRCLLFVRFVDAWSAPKKISVPDDNILKGARDVWMRMDIATIVIRTLDNMLHFIQLA